MKEFCGTSSQIFKLQKVEIGGVRGKTLSNEVKKINERFRTLYAVFGTKTYDCLNERDSLFLKDYHKFTSEVWKLDRKIGQILGRAFDDCNISISVINLLKIVDDLSLRGLIALELSDKMPLLIVMLNKEIDEARKTFEKYTERLRVRGKPICEKNMPTMSSKLKFINLLKVKILKTVQNFKDLQHPICYSPGGKLLITKYKTLQRDLSEYEKSVHSEWVAKAETTTVAGLKIPLLKRNKENILRVNFATETMSNLVNVRYLKKEFQTHNVPKPLKEIFKQFEYFKAVHNILDQVVDKYNYIKSNTNDIEYKLIKEEVDEINLLLKPAETAINWQSSNIHSYVENVCEVVSDLNERVNKAQDNVIAIYKDISKFEQIPMYSRNDEKNMNLFDFYKKDEKRKERYNLLSQVASRIHARMEENKNLLVMDMDSVQTQWNRYLKFVDGIVLDSLLKIISSSLSFLLDETDTNKNPMPLFTAKVELCEPDIIFRPSLDKNMMHNFYDKTMELLDDIFNMANLIPRIIDQSVTFHEEIIKHKELKKLKKTYKSRIESAISKALDETKNYQIYSFLWLDSKGNYMDMFLKYSRQLNDREIQKLSEHRNAIKVSKPKLSDFKKEIDHFEEIHNDIKKFEKQLIFDSWFIVDNTPLKMTLQMCAKRWSYMFKKHLLDRVVESLAEFEIFIEKCEISLQSQITEGDYDGLVKMMGLIKAVKDNQNKYDPLFEEVRNILALLNNYNVDVPEKSLQQLNLLPERWVGVLQLREAFTKKQKRNYGGY